MTVTAERRLLPLRWVLVVATVTVFAVSLLVVVAAWLGGGWLGAEESTADAPAYAFLILVTPLWLIVTVPVLAGVSALLAQTTWPLLAHIAGFALGAAVPAAAFGVWSASRDASGSLSWRAWVPVLVVAGVAGLLRALVERHTEWRAAQPRRQAR